MRFTGAITALITPFKDGEIDLLSFAKLLDLQMQNGIRAVLINGTTGESPTLSGREVKELLGFAKYHIDGRMPIIMGVGCNSTVKTLENAKVASAAGADALMVVAPYYNKPSQEGLYRHYKYIHDNTDMPIIIYNIPGRCAVDVADETILRLAVLPRIVAIKDATDNLNRPVHLRSLLHDTPFSLLTGNDGTAVAFNVAGGNGIISVTSNIIPKLICEVQDCALRGDFSAASQLHQRLFVLHEAMFCETNPVPLKYALYKVGLISSPEVRLPLVELPEEKKRKVEQAMQRLGLL